MNNSNIDNSKDGSALAQASVESSDMFIVKSANQVIEEAKKQPTPKELWKSFWYEGETCCLFADSNVGKSVYAVQIANSIAQYKRVLYFDFELSNKQFQMRYTDKDSGVSYNFSPNLFRPQINSAKFNVSNFEDVVVQKIEETAVIQKCSVIIIDNLSYLCNASDKTEVAGLLMQRLMNLKHKHGWSLLVLAHTPKRKLTNPITQNDLAGSKKLFNFFDSVFAIGKSAKDVNLRYVKQIKIRSGKSQYDSDNVIICKIEKINNFLQFVEQGFDCEWHHLKPRTIEDYNQDVQDIVTMRNQGLSIRKIAREVGISKSSVNRIIKNHDVPKDDNETSKTEGTNGTTENAVPDSPPVPTEPASFSGTLLPIEDTTSAT